MKEPWNLNITGKVATPDLAKNGRFQRAFKSFLEELETIGCTIETGKLEVAGTPTDVLAAVHAAA